ncbi:uncharacterized protein [Venturia canescens]|uniref:uncharacterized protein n=1 Tax=Venturia canescens TaxID=32260 RepID=UPI001C9C49D8|nr:uncharacterized protein LOC122413432 [Venturia canescens]
MSNKLATKHKSSLTLKSPIKKSYFNHSKHAENSEKCEKEFSVTIFPFIICLIFFIHWIIVCPLIWALLYRTEFSENWPNYWPYLYWLVAFSAWLLPMLIFLLIWRRATTTKNDRLISGANSIEIQHEKNSCLENNDGFAQPEILELTSVSRNKDEGHSEVHKTRKEKIKQLAPLVIHRNMSGQSGTENLGDVKIETPIEDEEKIEKYIDKDLMDKYNKFVRLDRPLSLRSSVASEKSNSDVPLSPRELFFIDLIRHAESNEDKNSIDSPTKLAQSISQKKTAACTETRPTEESSYFIANVESPGANKNEIFIEILEPEITLKSVTNQISIIQDCSEKVNVDLGL